MLQQLINKNIEIINSSTRSGSTTEIKTDAGVVSCQTFERCNVNNGRRNSLSSEFKLNGKRIAKAKLAELLAE